MTTLVNLSGGLKPVSDIPDKFHYKVAEKEYEFSLLSSITGTSYVYMNGSLCLILLNRI